MVTETLPLRDVYEIAYLAGGSWRVTLTAVAVCVESAQIRVDRRGLLTLVDPIEGHEVETAVAQILARSSRRGHDLCWALRDDSVIPALRRQLMDRRLVLDQRRLWSVWIAVSSLVVLAAAGLLRHALRPEVYLVVPALATAAVAGRADPAIAPAGRSVALSGLSAISDPELREALRLSMAVSRGIGGGPGAPGGGGGGGAGGGCAGCGG